MRQKLTSIINFNIIRIIESLFLEQYEKKDSSSVIAEMKNHEGYPRVEVLSGSNEVKITKSNFKELLDRLIRENFI